MKKVRYPAFDGTQACATMGTDDFYVRDYEPKSNKKRIDIENRLRKICDGCSFRKECLVWAVHHEEHGFWGGTNEEERKQIRKAKGIAFVNPASML